MKNITLFLLAICTIAFSFSACKTDPKTDPDTTTLTKETTVSMRLRAEPQRLNPMLTTAGWALEVCRLMYPTLLDYDPHTLKLSPVLVKSRPKIEVIKTGDRKGWTTYSYEILEEAVWDDGSPVTGHDYVYTMKTLFNPHVNAAPYRGYLELIKDAIVDESDPKKFTVYTDQKYIKAEYATGLFIYPQYKFDPDKVMDAYKYNELRNPELAEQFKNDEVLKAYGELFNSPKYSREKDFIGGCGAYELEEWVEGERIVLVRKENWWGTKLVDKYPVLTANPKRMIFRPISDAATALTLMKNQELDVITKIPEAQFEEFKNSEIGKQHFVFETPPLFGNAFYGLNTRNAKLSDKKVRRALAHLFDIDEVLEKVKLGYAEQVIGPFHPLRSYYHKGLEPIKLNVDKAKELLTEAGWTDSNNNGTVDKRIDGELVELELELLITTNNKPSSSMGIIFQNEAKKAGVKINVVEKANAALVAQLRTREFDIFARGIGAEVSADDPKQYWHTDSDSPGGYNRVGFGNAETDQLIEDIRSELDETKRNALFLKFQEILYEEQPAIFLYATKDRMAIHNRFKGVQTTIKTPGYFSNYWYE